MQVKQIYTILNTVIGETLGKTDLVSEDLTNLVDVGNAVFDADAVDKYTNKLINHIGKVIVDNRIYHGRAPSVRKDGWEYGSILEKIRMDMPEDTQTEDWELTDGTSYDQDIYHSAKNVSAKFFNKRTTFTIEISITEKLLKQSFSSVTQMNAFMDMVYVKVQNRLTIDYDNLIMRTINNMMFNVLASTNKVQAVNLLELYNANKGDTGKLTAKQCLTNLDFLKFASKKISMYSDWLTEASTLYNVGKKEKFTPKDLQHLILHSEFTESAKFYLQSDTFHDEFVKLPKFEKVTYWQGTGTNHEFASTSKITGKYNKPDDKTATGTYTGIIGCLFDNDALGVCNIENRVPTHYNAKGEFFNYYYKSDAGYFNDLDENCVVFYVADAA